VHQLVIKGFSIVDARCNHEVYCLACSSTVSCLVSYVEAYVATYCRDYAGLKQCFTTFSSIPAYIHQSQVLDLLRHVTTPNISLAWLSLIVI